MVRAGTAVAATAVAGRHRRLPLREVVNAIFSALRTGCPWRMPPKCLPPWRMVYRWFAELRDRGAWETLNHPLVMRDRERAGRAASPTAAVLDRWGVAARRFRWGDMPETTPLASKSCRSTAGRLT